MEFNSKGRKIAAKEGGNQGSIFLPKELVTEILVRLHIRPLFRFKLISKQWNSIISHPKFAHCYLQRASSSSKSSSQLHLWGILDPVLPSTHVFQQWGKLGDSSKPVSTLYGTDVDAPPSLYSSLGHKSYWPYEDRIMASTGGLILCISSKEYYSSEGLKGDIHVFNPLTRQSAKLPLLCRSYFPLTYGLATRPAQPAGGDHPAYVTYKVVVIQNTRPYRHGDDHCDLEIHTFSSDIGRWTQKKMTTTCLEVALICNRKESFTCRGILHWFDWDRRSVITYDPYNSPDRFGRIQLPSGSGKILENSGMNLIHFGHEDVLKFGDIECCNDHSRRLRVWQLLDHAKGEWRLEQTSPISALLVDERLSRLRKLVAPDPCNDELFCFIVEDMCRNFKAIDLGSAKEVFVGRCKSRTTKLKPYSSVVALNWLPIALCPWSSPFDGGGRSNPSSAEGFEKISNVWFPCFSKY